MGQINRHEIKCYLREIHKQLPLPRKRKRQVVLDLEQSILEYIEKNPDQSMDDIAKHYGSPDEFSGEYIASLDEKDIKRTIKQRGLLKKAIIIGLAIFILGTIVAFITVVIHNENARINTYEVAVSEDSQ